MEAQTGNPDLADGVVPAVMDGDRLGMQLSHGRDGAQPYLGVGDIGLLPV